MLGQAYELLPTSKILKPGGLTSKVKEFLRAVMCVELEVEAERAIFLHRN